MAETEVADFFGEVELDVVDERDKWNVELLVLFDEGVVICRVEFDGVLSFSLESFHRLDEEGEATQNFFGSQLLALGDI